MVCIKEVGHKNKFLATPAISVVARWEQWSQFFFQPEKPGPILNKLI